MDTKKTAVEWLVEQINTDCTDSTFIRKELMDEAIELEKEQLRDSWYDGNFTGRKKQVINYFQKYYDQTYKGDDK